jgi:hypothetical protein
MGLFVTYGVEEGRIGFVAADRFWDRSDFGTAHFVKREPSGLGKSAPVPAMPDVDEGMASLAQRHEVFVRFVRDILVTQVVEFDV